MTMRYFLVMLMLLGFYKAGYGMGEAVFKNNTEQRPIVFDLDDVIIAPQNDWVRNMYIVGKSLYPFNFFKLWTMKGARVLNATGTKQFKCKGEFSKGGFATSLTFYGMNGDKSIQPFIPTIIKTHTDYIAFLPGAQTVIEYLKNKGYPIIFATNKDALSFYKTVEAMDKKYQGKFSRYPLFTLVTQPTQEWLDKWLPVNKNGPKGKYMFMSREFAALVKEIHEAKERPNVYFVREFEKPETGYYKKLVELIDQQIPGHGAIYFFDDKIQNIIGAESAGVGIKGFVVTRTRGMKYVVEILQAYGIIAPDKDQELYKKLKAEGVL